MDDWRKLLTPVASARAAEAAERLRQKARESGDGLAVFSAHDFHSIDPEECTSPAHKRKPGPCTDVGQCFRCGSPVPIMRPVGETYGLHRDDCASPERHEGPCAPGGTGHGVGTVRGFWPGKDDDVAAAREKHGDFVPESEEDLWTL